MRISALCVLQHVFCLLSESPLLLPAKQVDEAKPAPLKEANVANLKENNMNQPTKKRVTFCEELGQGTKMAENRVIGPGKAVHVGRRALVAVDVPGIVPRERKGLRF